MGKEKKGKQKGPKDAKKQKTAKSEGSATSTGSTSKGKGIPSRGRFVRARKHGALFYTTPLYKGFLLSCDQNREDKAVTQINELLIALAAKHYPGEPKLIARKTVKMTEIEEGKEDKEEKEEEKEENVGVEEKGKLKRFRVIASGCKGIIFIAVEDETINPNEFVTKILADPDLSKFKVDHCARLIPIQRVCKANKNEIVENLKELIAQRFDDSKPISWKVEFKSRNCSDIDKEFVDEIAELVSKVHKVNLKNPDLTVIVEIFKSACGISIVDNWFSSNKFNLRLQKKEQAEKEEKS